MSHRYSISSQTSNSSIENNNTSPPISPRGSTSLPPIELPLPMIPVQPFNSNTTTTTTIPPHSHIVYSPLSQPHTMSPIALYPTPTTSTSNMTIAKLRLSRGSKASVGLSTADEREQHRRLSHSAIEKRRRERINDKIDQLKHLIPSCCPSTDSLPSASMHQPLHKLSVLQAAIDYIHQLHDQLIERAPTLLEKESNLDSSTSSELNRIISHVREQKEKQQDIVQDQSQSLEYESSKH
ncbi:unnamed protein product [Cunninghamella blakesleeana]